MQMCHTGCHSCQLRTGNWGLNWFEKTLLYVMNRYFWSQVCLNDILPISIVQVGGWDISLSSWILLLTYPSYYDQCTYVLVPCHKDHIWDGFLEPDKKITKLKWPAQSSDRKPVKHCEMWWNIRTKTNQERFRHFNEDTSWRLKVVLRAK